MTAHGTAPEPAEHLRFTQYLHLLESVTGADENDLVAHILDDPDALMADSAVCRHLDRRAAALLRDPRYPLWADGLGRTVSRSAFLTRRMHEWTLLRDILLDGPWTAADLLGASDWLQRKATAQHSRLPPPALRLLAVQGRTRRVRKAAAQLLASSTKPPEPS
ncbi:hypothetical protein [Streptomyces alfalfae]|uniref:HEAT repeat domain-containing protein n=1 Tax=Streptomyces alfalfae TaxID=1642299 RepID=A0A7T4PND5_9ACTN|nr:hypothetical protein [Streptomyces alfalfae]QQC93372.1 hypothetical protein I8755_37390 [Streptomyces alfalfae]